MDGRLRFCTCGSVICRNQMCAKYRTLPFAGVPLPLLNKVIILNILQQGNRKKRRNCPKAFPENRQKRFLLRRNSRINAKQSRRTTMSLFYSSRNTIFSPATQTSATGKMEFLCRFYLYLPDVSGMVSSSRMRFCTRCFRAEPVRFSSSMRNAAAAPCLSFVHKRLSPKK